MVVCVCRGVSLVGCVCVSVGVEGSGDGELANVDNRPERPELVPSQ